MLDFLVIDPSELQHVIEFFFNSEGQCDALRRGEMAEECAIPWLVIFDSVKDHRGRRGWVLAIEDIDDGAHFKVPVDIFERGELTPLFDDRQPIAQALIFHDRLLNGIIRSYITAPNKAVAH